MTEKETVEVEKVKEFAFVVPTDIYFESNVLELNENQLQRYHDVLHILWNKLQDGLGEFGEFKWTFNKVIFKHSEIVREMTRRGIRHYYPINKLDYIYADTQEYSISELSKKEEKTDDVSFEGNSINRIKKK